MKLGRICDIKNTCSVRFLDFDFLLRTWILRWLQSLCLIFCNWKRINDSTFPHIICSHTVLETVYSIVFWTLFPSIGKQLSRLTMKWWSLKLRINVLVQLRINATWIWKNSYLFPAVVQKIYKQIDSFHNLEIFCAVTTHIC